MTTLTPIQLLIMDVDGVLTDGKLYLSDDGHETKTFNTKDGLGISMLLRAGIQVALISGRRSTAVERRAAELGIQHVYQSQVNKLQAFQECCNKVGVTPEQCAYIGDDINDIPVMRVVGWSAAPSDAMPETREAATWVTERTGGAGAVREVCDRILRTQNLWPECWRIYGH